MVLRGVAMLIGLGLAIGLSAAMGATRFIASFLYGTKANDPWTLALAAGVLTLVASLAAFLPARSASRLDPMNALREEKPQRTPADPHDVRVNLSETAHNRNASYLINASISTNASTPA